MHTAWRNTFVALLAALAIVLSVSDIVLPWRPFGSFGLQLSVGGRVTAVTPQTSAANARIVPGDRIDISALPFAKRFIVLGPFSVAVPGTHWTIRVISADGQRRTVTLVSAARKRTLADNLADIFQCLTYFVSILLATALVMLRPGRVTWAFFAYILLSIGYALTPLTLGIPALGILDFTFVGLTVLAWIPLTIFALRFPTDRLDRFGQTLERGMLWSLVLLVPLALYVQLGALIDGPGRAQFDRALHVLPTFGLLLAGAMYARGYLAAAPVDRARIRWIITGFLAGYSGFVIHELFVVLAPAVLDNLWFNDLLLSTGIFAPIAVTYAIVRHRVFDIRIVVRRAAVYAVLTSVVIGVIAAFDFFVGKVFAGTKIAVLGEIGVAVIVGLMLNPLHRRLESAVDAAIFRRRLLGQERLHQVAAGLVHANSSGTVSRLLVAEPIDAFSLASAALFEADGSGNYVLADAMGWECADRRRLEHETSLVLRLIALRAPLRLTSTDLALLHGVPVGINAPVVAIPIVFRGELDGIVLYGAHLSGEEVDSVEVEALASLALAAGSAYDHLDAQATRAELAAYKAVVGETDVGRIVEVPSMAAQFE